MGRGGSGNFRWENYRSNASNYRGAQGVWGVMNRFMWLKNTLSQGWRMVGNES